MKQRRRPPIDFERARAKLRAAGFVADSARGAIEPAPPPAPAPAPLVSEPPCIFPVKGRYCGTCAACFRRLYGPEWYLR